MGGGSWRCGDCRCAVVLLWSFGLCGGCGSETRRIGDHCDTHRVSGHLANARVAKLQILHDQKAEVGINIAGGREGRKL